MPKRHSRPKTVTHPGTNRARRALTSFMRRTSLTTTLRRQPSKTRIQSDFLNQGLHKPLSISRAFQSCLRWLHNRAAGGMTAQIWHCLSQMLIWSIQGGPKKWGHKLTDIILSKLNRFTHFSRWRFIGKFAVNFLLKVPLLVACVTLWNINARKHATNDKLQGTERSVATTYLRCAGVVNNQIQKGLLLNLPMNKCLKLVDTWQSYQQKRVVVSCTLRVWSSPRC